MNRRFLTIHDAKLVHRSLLSRISRRKAPPLPNVPILGKMQGGYDVLLMWLFCRRWYYNRNQREEPVEDSSGHYVVRDGSLIIQGVQESDGGSYMCTASNSEGSESMEVRLTVSAPLNVHVQPSIQTVDLGKAAHLVIDNFHFSPRKT